MVEGLSANHAFFDFADYYDKLSIDRNLYDQMMVALSKVITYSDHTPTIYSAYMRGEFPVDNLCGISTYIPRAHLPLTMEAYEETEWYRATR